MTVLLHIQFDFDAEDPEHYFTTEAAEQLAQLPGLKWKVWAYNQDKKTGSGFYLYGDERDARIRAEKAVPHLQSLPGISNVTTRIYTVIDDLSRITRAPLDVEANPSYPEDAEA